MKGKKKRQVKQLARRILSGLVSLAMVLSPLAGITFATPPDGAKEVKAATVLTGTAGNVNIPSSMTGQTISNYYSTSKPTIYFGGVPWTVLKGASASTDKQGHPQNVSVPDSKWLLWANVNFGVTKWDPSSKNTYPNSGTTTENYKAIDGTYTLNSAAGAGYTTTQVNKTDGRYGTTTNGYENLKNANELLHNFTLGEVGAMKTADVYTDDYRSSGSGSLKGPICSRLVIRNCQIPDVRG